MPNQIRWVKNLNGDRAPATTKGLFQAGATQAILAGEILQLSGGNWVPMASDNVYARDVAIAQCEIKSGDLAGYYPIIVPRPGDVFEFALAAAGNPSLGTALYYSTSQVLTETAGTNVLARAADDSLYPEYQGHASDDASPDMGTTLRNVARVRVTIDLTASYYAAIVR